MKFEEIESLNKQLQLDLGFPKPNFQQYSLQYTLLFLLISFIVFVVILKFTVKNITKIKTILYSLCLSILVTAPIVILSR